MRRPSWWLDHLAASFIISIFNPLITFFSWPLVLSGGTALRLFVERRWIVSRRDVFRSSYVMAGVQSALLVIAAVDESATPGLLLFWIVFLAVLPTFPYAALMPVAGQRWFFLSRFRAWRWLRALLKP
jgi:hypothetical protein